MDTILEINGSLARSPGAVNTAIETIRQAHDENAERPRPEWVRGQCPQCGDDLVSNCYYVGGRGYLICWDCWASLKPTPTCTYRKVL
jgi:hypothetical protein